MTFKLSVWIEGFIKADKESFFLPFLTNLFHSGGSEPLMQQGANTLKVFAYSFQLQ